MLGFGTIGTWEILAILIIALLIFGTRLPKVMRAIGKSMSEFKKGMDDMEDSVEDVKNHANGKGKSQDLLEDNKDSEA